MVSSLLNGNRNGPQLSADCGPPATSCGPQTLFFCRQLHHLQKWGGEALQTKLLQCSRSRLIKQRISELQRLLSSPDQVVPPDSELQGFQDPFPASDIFVNDNQRTTDFLLADGSPSLTANQVYGWKRK